MKVLLVAKKITLCQNYGLINSHSTCHIYYKFKFSSLLIIIISIINIIINFNKTMVRDNNKYLLINIMESNFNNYFWLLLAF